MAYHTVQQYYYNTLFSARYQNDKFDHLEILTEFIPLNVSKKRNRERKKFGSKS